ncbi:FtsX-like permease family protein [Daejeonella lutea]|uniref:Lipoprotein-releasing system permease protein n=1 Tax=Daejeonella lutea TaxID=572036 RepID=A0A1T5DVS2_9SPHI|nr:FtsX-like permease family protein [Daejeonella lutea]SKB75741.1 lipoprotein-releasing system permease protein [Daejeonella lutea]
MNTSYYIAKRYLFSKKSVNAINFISGISMLGVFVGSAALIIILSVFNGFENIVLSMYNTFSPELRIELAEGKAFEPSDPRFSKFKNDGRIINYTEVLQEKALVRYGKSQSIALVKGVSDEYMNGQVSLDSAISSGSFILKEKGENFAVIGSAIQNYLSVNLNDDFRHLDIYSPRKNAANSLNPADEFNVMSIHPSGVFSVQQEFDNMMIVPIGFARELLGEESKVSLIEINTRDDVSVDDLQEEISENLGKDFVVKNRSQQNQLLYKILNSEKWAIFMILTFVLIIAIFNIIGSLTMLVIDKKKDIAILSSLGADNGLIRGIFFIEGMMISMVGCGLGMFAGLMFCLLQQHFGFIKMAGASLLIDSYPVGIKGTDFILVFGTVLLVSLVASAISSRLSVKNTGSLREEL